MCFRSKVLIRRGGSMLGVGYGVPTGVCPREEIKFLFRSRSNATLAVDGAGSWVKYLTWFEE